MNKKNVLLIVIMAVILIVAIGLTVYIVKQQQDIRSRASSGEAGSAVTAITTTAPLADAVGTLTPTVNPTATITPVPACQVPSGVQNVTIAYPYCPGGAGCSADFTKAQCSWDAVSGSTSYSVKILHVNDDGTTTPVQTDTVSTGTSDVFPVTQDNTYECDVSGTNSCGSGIVGQITQLCAASAPLTTVAPTIIPGTTTVPVATTAPIVVATTAPIAAGPRPTLPPTGGSSAPIIMFGISSIAITLIGGFLLLI